MTVKDLYLNMFPRKEKDNLMNTTTGPLAEIPVAAGVLQATADLLEQLGEFFDLHPAARVALGHFLAARDEHATDAAVEGVVTAYELTEAAELLRHLASAEREG
jgi:hypothetical protein